VTPVNGFQLAILSEMFCGKPEIELTHSEFPTFFSRARFPSVYDEPSSRFIRTVIPFKSDEIELEVDCRSLVDRYELIGIPIRIEQLKTACKTNSFETFLRQNTKPYDSQKFASNCINFRMPIMLSELRKASKKYSKEFVRKMENCLCWIRQMACCVHSDDKVQLLVEHLYKNLPTWKKLCGQGIGIYIHETQHIRYSFQYLSNGNLWMYFDYKYLEEIQFLAMNLSIDGVCRRIRFDQEVGKRIRKLLPCLNNGPGLPHYFDFFSREEKTPDGPIQIYEGKTNLNDSTLFLNKKKFSLPEQLKMTLELLRGLESLEKEGFVHCGIFPSTISLFWDEKDVVEAKLSNFGSGYFAADLSHRYHIPSRWQDYREPLVADHPFAVPVRQLGLCFKELFGDKSPPFVSEMIEGMTHTDLGQRWSVSRAIQALSSPNLSN
jgi:serine/threonine protein kinase